jgi:tripartite-type tricarboxylate transporter receptor subunit TctC
MVCNLSRNFAAALPAVLLSVAISAQAQTFPTKPIRLLVPFVPGGNVDLIARMIAPKASEALAQQILVDNRGGAGGVVGTEIVARAAPDGYNLLLVGSGHVMNPAMVRKLPYDSIRDFAPVAMVAEVPTTLVVHPSLPAKNVRELIALAKARPGELNYSTAGRGTNGHLAGELLNSMAGIKLEHVPYKGAAPALIDLLAGHVHMQFTSMPTILPYVRTAKLRMLAQTGSKRSPAAPNVPTMEESGLPGFVVSSVYSVLAPAGTPRAVVDRLQEAFKKAVANTDVRTSLAAQGADPIGSTPDELAAFNATEIQKWIKVARTAGIQPESF